MTDDWHLPTATVTMAADLRPEPEPEPLSYVEMVLLDTHPLCTCYPMTEYFEAREMSWLRFMRWMFRETGRL